MLVVIVGFNYDVVMMSGLWPAPTWVLVVIVGFNYDVVMMYVGYGLPPTWDFGVFVWYCAYDVMMSVGV